MGKTLSEHAAYELVRTGLTTHEDPEARKAATCTMALVRRFEKQKHSAATGMYTLQMFEDLCNFLPLTALTDDPAEWKKFKIRTTNEDTQEVTNVERWESLRSPSIFSEDGGKTWTDEKTGNTGTSLDHVLYDQRQKDEADKAAARKAAGDQDKSAEALVGDAHAPADPAAQAPNVKNDNRTVDDKIPAEAPKAKKPAKKKKK